MSMERNSFFHPQKGSLYLGGSKQLHYGDVGTGDHWKRSIHIPAPFSYYAIPEDSNDPEQLGYPGDINRRAKSALTTVIFFLLSMVFPLRVKCFLFQVLFKHCNAVLKLDIYLIYNLHWEFRRESSHFKALEG